MSTRRFLLGLVAFPIPPRWLPTVFYGLMAGVIALLGYLGATRGL